MATIDDELGARTVRTVVAREEECKLGDLIGSTRSGDRLTSHEHFESTLSRFGRGSHHRRGDHARVDRIDANAVGTQLERRGLRDASYRELGRGVTAHTQHPGNAV